MKSSSPLCFVNLDSLNVTPYFQQYEKCIDCEYDLIYWNRGQNDCNSKASHSYCFTKPVFGTGLAYTFRLLQGYLGFRSYASHILSNNHYERVIALTGNTAVLLSRILRQKYKHRYLIDIRDYFLEDFKPYRKLEEEVIEDSGLSIISSPEYINFLGQHDFQIMHNIQELTERDIDAVRQKERPSNPMILASIGTAKNIDLDKRVISYFANDDRFLLKFFGRGYDQLDSYCRENGIKNVIVHGDFPSNETLSYYSDVDVIMSMYGSEKTHFKYQLTNKLYYALQLGLPILASPNSYMGQVVSQYSLGIALDLDSSIAKESILSLYSEESVAIRLAGANALLDIVNSTNIQALDKIRSFLSS